MPESLKEDGRPSDQWYWDDWFAEFGLRLCSLGARGLWVDMLGIMWKAEIRGTLTVNGKQINNKELAKIVGDTEENVTKYIAELESNDVFSRLEDRTIISRRQYRQSKRKEEISRIRSEAGKKGMEARWAKENNKDDNKGDNKSITKITASSSSSISTSTSNKESPKIFSDAHLEIAELLKKKINERLPKHQIRGKSYLEAWANEARLMEEKKEATPEEMRALIIWIFDENDFWFKNILSMAKFREKFGRLWEEMKGSRPKRDTVGLSQKPLTEEQIQFQKDRDRKQEELNDKYWPEFEKARNNGDMKRIGEIESKIKAELAAWSREYWGDE